MWLRPTASWSPSTPTSRIVSGANGSSRPTSITLPSCSSRTTSGEADGKRVPVGDRGAGRQRVAVARELDVDAAGVGDAHQDLQRALHERALPAHPGHGVGEVGERGELRVAPEHLAAQVALAGDGPVAVPEDRVLAHEGERAGDRPGGTPDADRERRRAVHDEQHGQRRREDRQVGDRREQPAHRRVRVVEVRAGPVARQHVRTASSTATRAARRRRTARSPPPPCPRPGSRSRAPRGRPRGAAPPRDSRTPCRARRRRRPAARRCTGAAAARRAPGGGRSPRRPSRSPGRAARRRRPARRAPRPRRCAASRARRPPASRTPAARGSLPGMASHDGHRHPGGRTPALRPDLRDPSGPHADGAIRRSVAVPTTTSPARKTAVWPGAAPSTGSARRISSPLTLHATGSVR